MIGTQRYHENTSWEQYVAVVLSSLVNKVLQDDQVFAILGEEGREPRRHSPLPGNPLQETVSLKSKLGLSKGVSSTSFPGPRLGVFGDTTVADLGEGPAQTEARRAKIIFFLRPGIPYLRVWMTAPYMNMWIHHCNMGFCKRG